MAELPARHDLTRPLSAAALRSFERCPEARPVRTVPREWLTRQTTAWRGCTASGAVSIVGGGTRGRVAEPARQMVRRGRRGRADQQRRAASSGDTNAPSRARSAKPTVDPAAGAEPHTANRTRRPTSCPSPHCVTPRLPRAGGGGESLSDRSAPLSSLWPGWCVRQVAAGSIPRASVGTIVRKR